MSDKQRLRDVEKRLQEALDAMQEAIADRAMADANIAWNIHVIEELKWQRDLFINRTASDQKVVYRDRPNCTCPTCAVDGCQPELVYDWMNEGDRPNDSE